MYAIIKFSSVSACPAVRSLDLAAVPKMIRTKLYGCLDGFSGLSTVCLGSGSGGWVTEVRIDNDCTLKLYLL